MLSLLRPLSRRSTLIATLVTFAGLAAAAPAALGDSVTSTNWSGYVAHRNGVKYQSVASRWRQPSVSCTPGNPTYSAAWVGLGGYAENSQALEQIGTEIDCNSAGHSVYSAWYELVPALPGTIRMTVKSGDLMSASVNVVGRKATLRLSNLSRHTSFTKSVTLSAIDVTSADWIVEAPSECYNNTDCWVLPLADFHSERFSNAAARSTAGHSGAITSRYWGTSELTLVPNQQTYDDYGSAAESTPSALRNGGTAFSVTFSQAFPTTGPSASPFFSAVQHALQQRATTHLQPGGKRR